MWELLTGLIDWNMTMSMLPVAGIGFGFGFNQASSGFSNEQGVRRQNRDRVFQSLFPTIRQQIPQGLQTLREVDVPRFNIDQFGLFRTPGFNAGALVENLLGRALSQTAAQSTARGQVSPENLSNIARGATEQLAAGLIPLSQQNIQTATLAPQEFALARGQALLNPFLQTGLGLATGGGSGTGGSKSFGLSGNVSGL